MLKSDHPYVLTLLSITQDAIIGDSGPYSFGMAYLEVPSLGGLLRFMGTHIVLIERLQRARTPWWSPRSSLVTLELSLYQSSHHILSP